jgi:hypothetical protein
MKRFLTIASALFIGIATLSSCGANNGTIVYPNSLTATVGGVISFTSSGRYISATKTNNTLNISAITTGNSTIAFTVPSFSNTVGALSINSIGLPAGASFDSLAGSAALIASTGTITFTSVSPYLEGTFSFVCSDSTKISGGTFKIKAP